MHIKHISKTHIDASETHNDTRRHVFICHKKMPTGKVINKVWFGWLRPRNGYQVRSPLVVKVPEQRGNNIAVHNAQEVASCFSFHSTKVALDWLEPKFNKSCNTYKDTQRALKGYCARTTGNITIPY